MPETNMPKESYIDLETGLGRVRGNKKIYARMLGLFLASEEFAQLKESLAAGDIERAGELAHAVKGMTGNLTLTALFDVSTTLMGQLRDGVLDEPTAAELFTVYDATRKVVEEEMAALSEG